VEAVRYPPLGDRGILDCGRVSHYGRLPLKQHIEESNREVLLAVMIEDLAAVEEIDAIANTPGLDLVAIGPADLARALGVSGTTDHPKMVATVERIAEAVRKAGIARLAMPNGHPTFPRTPAELRHLGCGYTTCAPYPEVRLLRDLTRQAEEARRNLAG
jgi:2-keto-3-deoxy-L-rhamnonate aldolase RhmA